jgi:Ca2+-binding RTX toxin-like protein
LRTTTRARFIGVAAAALTVTALSPVGSSQAVEVEAVEKCDGLVATIVGTEGDDVLVGTEGNDVIVGLGGDDVIDGLGGDDVICGGDGDDVIRGGEGNDTIHGGAGNDTLYGGAGDDVVKGGPDDDRISGGTGDDTLSGSKGSNCLDLDDTGDEPARTDVDAAEVNLALGTSTGFAGTDKVGLFTCVITGQGKDTVVGDAKDNLVIVPSVEWADAAAAPPRDELVGGGGKDTIELMSSANVDLAAGTFDDTRFPEATAPYGGSLAEFENVMLHGAGVLRGDEANNVLTVTGKVAGVPTASAIYGGAGNDTLTGGAGDDVIKGGPGRDNLRGRGGDDTMSGSKGDDIMRGGAGNDVMRGASGDDWISGSAGDDDILGGPGRDEIFGKSGDDRLRGGKGKDRINGGPGLDTCLSPSGPPLAKRCN